MPGFEVARKPARFTNGFRRTGLAPLCVSFLTLLLSRYLPTANRSILGVFAFQVVAEQRAQIAELRERCASPCSFFIKGTTAAAAATTSWEESKEAGSARGVGGGSPSPADGSSGNVAPGVAAGKQAGGRGRIGTAEAAGEEEGGGVEAALAAIGGIAFTR